MICSSCYAARHTLHSFPTRRSSDLTREVLRALRGFTNVIWPTSLEAALQEAGSADAACLVIADDLRSPEKPRRRSRLPGARSEEHTSELQSQSNLVCRLLLEKKKQT